MNRPSEFANKAIILGVKIDNQPLEWFLSQIEAACVQKKSGAALVYTPNPEICLKAAQDDHYREILNESLCNLPDGIGLKMAAKILDETLTHRVTGVDLTASLLQYAQEYRRRIFVLLRTDSLVNCDELRRFFTEKYSQIVFDCASLSLTEQTAETVSVDKINAFAPDLLFVCLGAPHQEKWLASHAKELSNVGVGLGVGGSFDFLSGKIKRAPKILRDLGLEWSFRLLQEPQRIGRIKNALADFLLVCRRWKKRLNNEYRPNVLIVLRNNDGDLLIQKSSRLREHWQFPQGGIAPDEELIAAAAREIFEELGIESSLLTAPQILQATNVYDWPDYARKLKGYKGQKQQVVTFRFVGKNSEIHPEEGNEVEKIAWVAPAGLLNQLHPVRREFAKKILSEL